MTAKESTKILTDALHKEVELIREESRHLEQVWLDWFRGKTWNGKEWVKT